MKTYKRILVAFLTLAGITFGSTAQAGLILEISDGTTTQTVTDGGAGFVSFSGSIGDFRINSLTGIGNAALGISPSLLHLNSFNVSNSSSGGSLSIRLSADGYGPLTGGERAVTNVGGVLADGASALFQSYIDTTNTLLGTDTALADLSFTSGGAFSATSSSNPVFSGPYAMTVIASLTHPAGDFKVSSFDFEVKVPEPSILALLGIGALGLGLIVSLRRRRPQAG